MSQIRFSPYPDSAIFCLNFNVLQQAHFIYMSKTPLQFTILSQIYLQEDKTNGKSLRTKRQLFDAYDRNNSNRTQSGYSISSRRGQVSFGKSELSSDLQACVRHFRRIKNYLYWRRRQQLVLQSLVLSLLRKLPVVYGKR